MRVITGTARGKRLVTPEGRDVTRPTGEKVKEAIFSSIQFLIEEADVLDLFAGSGQLGIEALSRGAKSCVFVDSAKVAQKCIIENIKNCKQYIDTDSKIVVLSSNYHVYRASKICEKAGFTVHTLGSKAPLLLLPNQFLHEKLGFIKMWIFM